MWSLTRKSNIDAIFDIFSQICTGSCTKLNRTDGRLSQGRVRMSLKTKVTYEPQLAHIAGTLTRHVLARTKFIFVNPMKAPEWVRFSPILTKYIPQYLCQIFRTISRVAGRVLLSRERWYKPFSSTKNCICHCGEIWFLQRH